MCCSNRNALTTNECANLQLYAHHRIIGTTPILPPLCRCAATASVRLRRRADLQGVRLSWVIGTN